MLGILVALTLLWYVVAYLVRSARYADERKTVRANDKADAILGVALAQTIIIIVILIVRGVFA